MKARALKLLIISMILSLAVSAVAVAAFLESDAEAQPDYRDDVYVPPPRRIIPPYVPPRPPSNDFYSYVSSLNVTGASFEQKGLRIFPLTRAKYQSSQSIITLDDAFRRGDIVISEHGSGIVSKVSLTSYSNSYIFIMAGEIIAGGRQTRAMVKDILLPPRARNFVVDVYCIEEGRWEDTAKKFTTAEPMLNSNIRKRAMQERGQSDIWNGIREYEKRAKKRSDTHNLLELYRGAQGDKTLGKKIRYVRRRLPYNSVGMVAVKDGTIVGLEAFGSHQLFVKQFDKLFTSYYYADLPVTYNKSVERGGVRRFILNLRSARVVRDSSYIGSGTLNNVSYRGYYGSELELGGVVHISVIR